MIQPLLIYTISLYSTSSPALLRFPVVQSRDPLAPSRQTPAERDSSEKERQYMAVNENNTKCDVCRKDIHNCGQHHNFTQTHEKKNVNLRPVSHKRYKDRREVSHI